MFLFLVVGALLLGVGAVVIVRLNRMWPATPEESPRATMTPVMTALSQEEAVARAQAALAERTDADRYDGTPSRVVERADVWLVAFPMKPPVRVRPSEVEAEVRKSDGAVRFVPLR